MKSERAGSGRHDYDRRRRNHYRWSKSINSTSSKGTPVQAYSASPRDQCHVGRSVSGRRRRGRKGLSIEREHREQDRHSDSRHEFPEHLPNSPASYFRALRGSSHGLSKKKRATPAGVASAPGALSRRPDRPSGLDRGPICSGVSCSITWPRSRRSTGTPQFGQAMKCSAGLTGGAFFFAA
jgi:hypothetical protein